MQLTNYEIEQFQKGEFYYSYKKFGCHLTELDGVPGAYFTVWAPNAEAISVIGDFNNWEQGKDKLSLIRDVPHVGIWQGFVAGVQAGHLYKYFIESKFNNYKVAKADPYAFQAEVRPQTASVVYDLNQSYAWQDLSWLVQRESHAPKTQPINIYEMHLASWFDFKNNAPMPIDAFSQSQFFDYAQRVCSTEVVPFVTYRDLAETLPQYLKHLGFTYVEFLPIFEHPFDGSWGYQLTGYFAPTSRYGTPEDFKYLIDKLHQHQIGVILDIVPAHFAIDEHGLVYFDGTHLYEHADPRKGFHPDWGTYVFNFGRPEVVNFLISHVLFWINEYHIDGLRLDAVASMLYLDYSRQAGEWLANQYGGNENLEALSFIKKLNETVAKEFVNVLLFAEESTAWPKVSHPIQAGGLGFSFKWNMGWMTDVLAYLKEDPIYRVYHHDKLTFSMFYAFSEDFVLPFSHDEVVHGKGSLLRKFPGPNWQKFAGLRGMLGYMYGHPGKKLLFMGTELAEWDEWWYQRSLNWNLLNEELNRGVFNWVKDLNHFLMSEPALYELDFSPAGFEWIDCNNAGQNIVSFVRFNMSQEVGEGFTNRERHAVLVISNFSPLQMYNYRIGVPYNCNWQEVLNSDLEVYGGSGVGNFDLLRSSEQPYHMRDYSIELSIPPLATIFLKPHLDY